MAARKKMTMVGCDAYADLSARERRELALIAFRLFEIAVLHNDEERRREGRRYHASSLRKLKRLFPEMFQPVGGKKVPLKRKRS